MTLDATDPISKQTAFKKCAVRCCRYSGAPCRVSGAVARHDMTLLASAVHTQQPPVIPHAINGCQITLHTNQYLSCRARQFIEGSGAPMISVTHFIDRDGQILADVTPRRYFCNAFHVPQTDAKLLVPNTFRDAAQRAGSTPRSSSPTPRHFVCPAKCAATCIRSRRPPCTSRTDLECG